MTDPLESALALLFRRYRDPPVSEDDLVKGMSLTLTWTKPSNAPHLLARGVQDGLLEHTEDGYTPRFSPGEVDVPFGFDPPSELFEPLETSPPRPEESPATSTSTSSTSSSEETATGGNGDAWTDAPVLETLVDRIAKRLEEGDRRAAIAAVNAKQEALGSLVTLPAAALLVARELGLDTREESDAVLEQLRSAA